MSTQDFTFDVVKASVQVEHLLIMKPFLSVPDLAKLAGYTRAQMCNFAAAGTIPAARINRPGGKHYRYPDTPELRAWCALIAAARRRRKRLLPTRAGRSATSVVTQAMRLQCALNRKLLDRPLQKSRLSEIEDLESQLAPIVEIYRQITLAAERQRMERHLQGVSD